MTTTSRSDARRAKTVLRIAEAIQRDPLAAHRRLGNLLWAFFGTGMACGFVLGWVLS